jgi:GT2 family glycosyltransferase
MATGFSASVQVRGNYNRSPCRYGEKQSFMRLRKLAYFGKLMPSNQNGETLVSILICSKDRREELISLVRVLNQLDTRYRIEIIVVEETDDPSPISGAQYISHPVENRGIPYARNLALAHVSGEIIIFLDDDCMICDDWLDELLKPFEDTAVAGVQGGVSVPDATAAIGWAESMLGFPGGGVRRILESKGQFQETREISTLNCAYRKWVIDEIGGFNNQLKFGGEDYVLAKQACKLGRCIFAPKAVVNHEPRGHLLKIWEWFIRRGQADIDVLRNSDQQERTLISVIKSSLTLKIILLLLLAFFFSDQTLILILLFVLAHVFLQYIRHFKLWRLSKAPFYYLMILPLVKFIMDIGMDWGRLRGLGLV